MMRALTIRQPWCGLVAAGVKRIENRSRSIIPHEDFGRPFALHAGRDLNEQSYPDIVKIVPRMVPYVNWVQLASYTSAVIAVATVDRAVHRSGRDARVVFDRNDGSIVDLGDQEPWFFGPIGYVLRDIRALRSPVTCRGWLGFWTLPTDAEARVTEQIGAT